MSGLFTTLFQKRAEFSRNQRMTRNELEELKLNKFRHLVQHAQKNSKYYQRIISESAINTATCVPSDFPILTKSILLEQFDDIVTDQRINKRAITEFLSRSKDPNELLFNEYCVVHTSGSSGQVGFFVFSQADWGRGMAQFPRQLFGPVGEVNFRRRRIAYFGAIDGHFAGVTMLNTARRGILKWLISLSMNDVNDPLPKVIRNLNEFQPDVLSGYTTALKMLAEKQLSGELNISPQAVATSGEAQSAADRDLFIKAFNCEVSNGYGCSEHLMVGSSDPGGENMVLHDDDLIFEFGTDHTVITNLFNFTLPLIRYQMSDIFQKVENDESAEPYLLIRSLVGRTELVPKFVNQEGVEDFISPFTIIELFIPGVSRFQMRLIDKDKFEFAICLDPKLEGQGREATVTATEQRLREVLTQKLMQNVKFEVMVLDDLPINPDTGKFQLIADKQSVRPTPN